MHKTTTFTAQREPKAKQNAQDELCIPNDVTKRTIEDALAGRNLKTFETIADALKHLGLPDT